MNILILGNGAREETIKDTLYKNNKNIICECSSIESFEKIKDICVERKIDLVIPSTEVYLCKGIRDYLQKEVKDIMVFGPNKYQSQIEGSKHYSKKLMEELDIPTSNFVYLDSYERAKNFYSSEVAAKEMVIKYNGLAKGKGVFLPDTVEESLSIVKNYFASQNNSGVIVEGRLCGKEVSVLAFCNGKEAYLMPQSQDYKRIYDGDKGPNTGGMGAICPANILTPEELIEVKNHMDKVVKKLNYKGVLYAGLMKRREGGVFFLEFNCRLGDPETQVILNLLDSNLLDIMKKCIRREDLSVKWKNTCAATVVLSHVDYPEKKLKEVVNITYSDDVDETVKIYNSNVMDTGKYQYTNGGRVMSMVSVADTLQVALENIYNNIHKISYEGVYYRRDIGSNDKKEKNIPISIGIMASGNGTSVEKLLEERHQDIKIIITNKTTAGIQLKAKKYNIPFFCFPQNKNDSEKDYYEKIVNILRQFNIEILILSGYMNIVPEVLFGDIYTINIHPSLLPKYKGYMDLDTHKAVIMNNEKYTGCTLHVVSKKIDSGRILLQKQCEVLTEDPEILKKQVQELEKDCIVEYINRYTSNKQKIHYDVNIEEGNLFVEELKKENEFIGGFCAEYKHKGVRLAVAADGCGTKIDLSNKYNKLDTIGIDLVAMNVNDLLAGGAKPLFFMDYIAIDKMSKEKCDKIIKGINKGCDLAKCKLIGGETAEMKGIYLKDKLDIAGFSVGEIIYDLPKKELMNEDCILYGIPSSGIHSNGYTLVRELLTTSFYPINKIYNKKILEPTRIYIELLDLYEKYPNEILGVAHITGGGFEDNIQRILPEGINFELCEWEFPSIFKWIQKRSGLNRHEMLRTFNCGYGMVIISSANLPFDKIGRLYKK